mgnify:CR=1 FL=1
MSSDIYFNVAFWFPGNVPLKLHFITQCPLKNADVLKMDIWMVPKENLKLEMKNVSVNNIQFLTGVRCASTWLFTLWNLSSFFSQRAQIWNFFDHDDFWFLFQYFESIVYKLEFRRLHIKWWRFFHNPWRVLSFHTFTILKI